MGKRVGKSVSAYSLINVIQSVMMKTIVKASSTHDFSIFHITHIDEKTFFFQHETSRAQFFLFIFGQTLCLQLGQEGKSKGDNMDSLILALC